MSELRYDTVTFLSDYGSADEFVGVVKSVIRQMAPDVTVIDLTHDIAPFDVRGASMTLARSVQYLCPGVILAVVDPGVGTDRRAVAVEINDGAAVFVGPDNGLLAAAVGLVGGATRAVLLDDPTHHLEGPGPTFDGRDVFAPAAALLCSGADLADLGTEIDPGTLMPGLMPLTRVEDGWIEAEVLWVDRFGNVQLNVDPDELAEIADPIEIRTPGQRRVARRVRTFGDLRVGDLGLVIDSVGLLAIVVDRASAAEELDVAAGDSIGLREAGEQAPRSVAVTLGVGVGVTGGGGGARTTVEAGTE